MRRLRRRIEEVPPKGVGRGERDGMKRAIDLAPTVGQVGGKDINVCRIVDVHFQDITWFRESIDGSLGETHAPAKTGGDYLGALFLNDAGDVPRDGVGCEHTGDEQFLALEQHQKLPPNVIIPRIPRPIVNSRRRP